MAWWWNDIEMIFYRWVFPIIFYEGFILFLQLFAVASQHVNPILLCGALPWHLADVLHNQRICHQRSSVSGILKPGRLPLEICLLEAWNNKKEFSNFCLKDAKWVAGDDVWIWRVVMTLRFINGTPENNLLWNVLEQWPESVVYNQLKIMKNTFVASNIGPRYVPPTEKSFCDGGNRVEEKSRKNSANRLLSRLNVIIQKWNPRLYRIIFKNSGHQVNGYDISSAMVSV